MCCVIFSDSIGPDFFDGEKAVYFFQLKNLKENMGLLSWGYLKMEVLFNHQWVFLLISDLKLKRAK